MTYKNTGYVKGTKGGMLLPPGWTYSILNLPNIINVGDTIETTFEYFYNKDHGEKNIHRFEFEMDKYISITPVITEKDKLVMNVTVSEMNHKLQNVLIIDVDDDTEQGLHHKKMNVFLSVTQNAKKGECRIINRTHNRREGYNWQILKVRVPSSKELSNSNSRSVGIGNWKQDTKESDYIEYIVNIY